ncbi:hypothetical protein ACFWCA_34230 [Streptomyces phaeochromogenes]|uniref:hypothetical protein n=1 Tax=Streptomyces phaeochromogenes TaxID=1923 RepID=UPI0036AAA30E
MPIPPVLVAMLRPPVVQPGVPPMSQRAVGRDGFEFTAPITRDGPGWRATGELPRW